MIKGILKELVGSGKDSIRKQITLPTGGSKVVLLVNVTTLKDENSEFMGTVVVFDDLTQLLKAQRMAAWREVARRIAHEIKNPLTPIQLSAQRLRRRYLDKFDAEDSVFDECTGMIIKQVDDLKNLVNEFSSFARMPASNPSPNNLNDVVSQALVLFQEGHKEINFKLNLDTKVPTFNLDHEQIRRVVINLLDNAVAAVDGSGIIGVETSFNSVLQIVTLKISDNGCGIPAEDKPRLFEPYFSTKKSGTGLGLAICRQLIEQQGGTLDIKSRVGEGTRVLIHLPINSESVPVNSEDKRA